MYFFSFFPLSFFFSSLFVGYAALRMVRSIYANKTLL
jgi:hypothetical protein